MNATEVAVDSWLGEHVRKLLIDIEGLRRDPDQAMNWLDKAYNDRFNPGVLLRPGFDPLRSDPRFQNLERRIGLRV